MNRKQSSKRTFIGFALLAIGMALLVSYSAPLAWQFSAAGASADSLGFLGSIGFASLHAFRLVMLDQAALVSVAYRILLLCSALMVTLIGMALVKRRSTGATALPRRGGATTPKGDQ